MHKSTKIFYGTFTLLTLMSFGACSMKGCGGGTTETEIKLTVWVSEADKPFAQKVADEFKAKHPDKHYVIVIDAQGENDVATRVLNDVENAADVYSCLNDQLSKLVNGDALAKIAGDRLERIKKVNTADSIDAVTLSVDGVQSVYGMPYTDNTFFLYYDKSILTETDVQSIDGILSKCTSDKKFAFPISDGWYTTAFYFAKGLGFDIEYDANFGEKKIACDFDNETGKNVTNSIWNLVKDTRVKADVNDSKITAGFSDGSIIAAASGIWNRTAIERALGESFGAVKLPTYSFIDENAETKQTQLVAFAGYKLMGINNYSAHKTDAMEFAELYTNRENQIKHFEMRGYLPTDETARGDSRVQADICARAISEQLQYSKTQKGVPSTLWVPMEGLGSAMITGAQNGNFNLETQLKACVDAIKKNA